LPSAQTESRVTWTVTFGRPLKIVKLAFI
jgi:hypothetical protein